MQIDTDSIASVFKNKKVIILGSAPSVVNNSATFIDTFDVVVRLNNYKFFNECRRVDVYYSYFGRNIKKSLKEVLADKVKFLMCKYPDADFRDHNGGIAAEGIAGDFRVTYKQRGDFFERSGLHYYIPDMESFKKNYRVIGRIPTTGMAAILDILKYKPSSLFVCGFDFFSTKMHNINEAWREGDGNHDNNKEKDVFKILLENCDNLSCDNAMRSSL